MTEFEAAVAKVVKSIRKGQTLGYGQVALLAGKPGAARAVVRALYSDALKGAPWWRVIKSDGTIAKEMMVKQAPRLKREGVTVEGRRVVGARRSIRKASHS